jgi:hypothetical protein
MPWHVPHPAHIPNTGTVPCIRDINAGSIVPPHVPTPEPGARDFSDVTSHLAAFCCSDHMRK